MPVISEKKIIRSFHRLDPTTKNLFCRAFDRSEISSKKFVYRQTNRTLIIVNQYKFTVIAHQNKKLRYNRKKSYAFRSVKGVS